jgi:LmbE family N-acetylglucosaminyl deacetylase
MEERQGFTKAAIVDRNEVIERVVQAYGMHECHIAPFATMELDIVPLSDRVSFVSSVFKACQPNIVYLPHPSDIHSDHAAVYDAVKACTKSFRYPSVQSVRLYETLSETDFALPLNGNTFSPNLFVDVSGHFQGKLQILEYFRAELGEHPFPRSMRAVEALATLRGAVAGVEYAEAFVTVKEIVRL